ncbi:hypothetical protein ACFPRG_27430 [Deinococcus cellulosilyticus]
MPAILRLRFTLAESMQIMKSIPEEDLVCLGLLGPEAVAAVLEVAPVKFQVLGWSYVPRRYERQARLVLASLN